jgi:hypothetical protein
MESSSLGADHLIESSSNLSVDTATLSVRPWSPWMAFANAIVLGPIAGVLVAYVNLKRLGLAARSGAMLWGGILGAALLVLANTLAVVPRMLNYIITLAWAYHLYVVQEPACTRWKNGTSASYRTGWSTLGWGVLGLLIVLALFLLFDLAFSSRVPA